MPEGIRNPDPNPSEAERAYDRKLAIIATQHGLVNASTILAEARREGVGHALAAAVFEKESNGRNVVGHDRDSRGCYIFPAGDGTVQSSKALYLEYKRRRLASGNRVMQGFGPAQLTWWELQDQADREGGCWLVGPNVRVGLIRLRKLVLAHGLEDGIRRYNGSGAAAEAYARDVIAKWRAWQKRFSIK